MARRDIYDAQTPMAQTESPAQVHAFVVWSAMRDYIAHLPQHIFADLSARLRR